jgi:hypothetical protein
LGRRPWLTGVTSLKQDITAWKHAVILFKKVYTNPVEAVSMS